MEHLTYKKSLETLRSDYSHLDFERIYVKSHWLGIPPISMLGTLFTTTFVDMQLTHNWVEVKLDARTILKFEYGEAKLDGKRYFGFDVYVIKFFEDIDDSKYFGWENKNNVCQDKKAIRNSCADLFDYLERFKNKKYHLLKNNCQHLAEDTYKYVMKTNKAFINANLFSGWS